MPAGTDVRVLLVAFGVGSLTLAADPPRATTEGVRATITKLWSNNGDEAAKGMLALEAEPLALPVLRRALATDPNISHRGVLERLIAKTVQRRDTVTAGRVEQWAKDSRLDLLTEVRALTDDKAADAAIDHLLECGQRLRSVGHDQLNARLPQPKREFLTSLPGSDQSTYNRDKTTPVFDAELSYPEKRSRTHLTLFADRVRVPTRLMEKSVVVARSEFNPLSDSGEGECRGCLLLVNGPCPLGEVRASVVVIDGDLELSRLTLVHTSVLVVNGDITREDGRPGQAFYHTVAWATGDVRLRPNYGGMHSVFLVGGKVENADTVALKGCVEENMKEPPLPVRFLDPAEFGLTLDATKEGMKVAKVADKTAFADAGLKAGDVIARVGEVATTTAPAFRRELRRGVVEGAVLLDVLRGKEKLELLVAVPDVPPAPKKDKNLKATPPDKK